MAHNHISDKVSQEVQGKISGKAARISLARGSRRERPKGGTKGFNGV